MTGSTLEYSSGASSCLDGSITGTESETGFDMTVYVVRNALDPSDDIQSMDDSSSIELIRADIHDLPSYCSIKEFSSAMGFDELQHAYFVRAAVPLILSLRPNEVKKAMEILLQRTTGMTRANQEQSLERIASPTVFYISGEGGCVKSWVELGQKIL